MQLTNKKNFEKNNSHKKSIKYFIKFIDIFSCEKNIF